MKTQIEIRLEKYKIRYKIRQKKLDKIRQARVGQDKMRAEKIR